NLPRSRARLVFQALAEQREFCGAVRRRTWSDRRPARTWQPQATLSPARQMHWPLSKIAAIQRRALHALEKVCLFPFSSPSARPLRDDVADTSAAASGAG